MQGSPTPKQGAICAWVSSGGFVLGWMDRNPSDRAQAITTCGCREVQLLLGLERAHHQSLDRGVDAHRTGEDRRHRLRHWHLDAARGGELDQNGRGVLT